MKRLFVLFLLLFSITTFASTDLYNLLKDQRFDLAYGVTLPDTPALTDFSVRYPTQSATSTLNTEPLVPYSGVFDAWYKYDFSEDPFDGRIEVLVVGEPSAPVNISLMLALATSVLLYSWKYTPQKGINSYDHPSEKRTERWA